MSKSCEMIAERVSKRREDHLKQFLVKIAQVIRLGDELRSFLKQELGTALQNFTSNYDRNLESQKLFLEMFYTIMSTSSIMIAANSLLVMLVGGVNGEQLMTVAIVTVIASMGGFAFMLFVMFPREAVVIKGFAKIKKLTLMIYLSISLAVTLGIVLYFTHALPSLLVLLVSGLPLVIVGMFSKKIESFVSKYAQWYPSVIMHFGQIYATVGSIGISLDAVQKSDFGTLNKHISALNNRIKHKINPELAFELFSKDTGSAVIAAGNMIISKALVTGADMKEISFSVAEITNKVYELKLKRQQMSKTFEMIVIIMHVLTLAVFGLMNKIVGIFTLLLKGQMHEHQILPIHPIDPQFMDILLLAVILSLSIISGFAIKISQGGLYKSALYYIGLLIILGSATVYGTTLALSNFLDTNILNLAS
ncbi:MAG: flagellar assembly protein FlaJ [Thaumarchaeota archaeon]|nr:flagellar assembly protein FlaJ [Nitrososphaerota archaeon]MBI3641147.1 flagellar assembly protein FlaJ [Nitrososphaerota archaeon]